MNKRWRVKYIEMGCKKCGIRATKRLWASDAFCINWFNFYTEVMTKGNEWREESRVGKEKKRPKSIKLYVLRMAKGVFAIWLILGQKLFMHKNNHKRWWNVVLMKLKEIWVKKLKSINSYELNQFIIFHSILSLLV